MGLLVPNAAMLMHLYTYGGTLPFRALCVSLQRLLLYVTICPTIFFEGIELFMGWMNVQTLERAPIPVFGKLARCSTHGHSFTRLWYIHVHVWCNNACSSQTYISLQRLLRDE